MVDSTNSNSTTAPSADVVNSAPSYTGVGNGGDGAAYTGPMYDPDIQEYTGLLIADALYYARDRQVFSLLGNTASMSRNMGKTLSQFIEIPLLDDLNKNDQGIDAKGATIANGNLYGSSTNIGQVMGALPELPEAGGRVNRVGFTRIKREATIKPYGFFFEVDNQMLQFDNQGDLGRSLVRRAIDGTLEMIDHMTQLRILQNVGTSIFTGGATTIADMSPSNQGKTAADSKGSVLNTAHLARLEEILAGNRTPMSQVLLEGSRNIDTKVIRSSRIAFCGVQMVNYLRTLQDTFGNPAFIDVAQYSSNGNVIAGEVGSIGGFRIIQVRRMLNYAGSGAVATPDDQVKYRTSMGTDGKVRFDVFPFLVLGDEAFASSGLEMSNGQYRLNLISKYPGRETAHQFNDPFGERGFTSIKFWHGFLPLKTERIACVYSVLPII